MDNLPPITAETDFEQLFFGLLTGQYGNEQGYYSYPGFLEVVELHGTLAGVERARLEAAILDLLRDDYHFRGSRRMPLNWFGPAGEEMYLDVDKDDWTLQWYGVAWSQSLKLQAAIPRLEALLQTPYYSGDRPDQEYVRGYAANVLRELREE